MKHLRNVAIAVIVGLVLAVITSQFTTTNYPPCDLVAKGINVSTYGCSNTTDSPYPCESTAPNSKAMSDCVGQNYYREKTFPFGFTQPFGPQSNLEDPNIINENRLASFALGFIVTIVILYVFQNRFLK